MEEEYDSKKYLDSFVKAAWKTMEQKRRKAAVLLEAKTRMTSKDF